MRPAHVDRIYQKIAYFQKLLSPDGFMDTWRRYIDMREMLAKDFWLTIPVYDLSNLGIGLIYLLTPVELEPLSVLSIYYPPTFDELEQGIWAVFEKFDFSEGFPSEFKIMFPEWFEIKFPEFEFIFDFLLSLVNFDFLFDFLGSAYFKAYFGTGLYGVSVYDPSVMRDYLRSGLYKTRQIRYCDISYSKHTTILESITGAHELNDYLLETKLSLLVPAQTQCFLLGLSPLGTGRFSQKTDDMATITTFDAQGNPIQVKFNTLEELIFGLFLGITPLGFGCIVPPRLTFNFKDGKKMPEFFHFLHEKITVALRQTMHTPWAYRNYHKVSESVSPFVSERTGQYHSFQTIRAFIEDFTSVRIPAGERDPVRIRQYQNALLQLISYPAKRHKWGFQVYSSLNEDEFKEFWIRYWVEQGLNRNTLEYLYSEIKPCLSTLRSEKLSLGEKLKRQRKILSKM